MSLIWTIKEDLDGSFGLIKKYDITLNNTKMELRVDPKANNGWQAFPQKYWLNRGRVDLQRRINILFGFCECADLVQLIISFTATAKDMKYQ